MCDSDEGGPNVIVQQLIVEPTGHEPFMLDLTGKRDVYTTLQAGIYQECTMYPSLQVTVQN